MTRMTPTYCEGMDMSITTINTVASVSNHQEHWLEPYYFLRAAVSVVWLSIACAIEASSRNRNRSQP